MAETYPEIGNEGIKPFEDTEASGETYNKVENPFIKLHMVPNNTEQP